MKMPAHEENVVRENFNWIFLYVLINKMAPRIPAQKILDAYIYERKIIWLVSYYWRLAPTTVFWALQSKILVRWISLSESKKD